jgi:hypothetical protein
MTNEQKKHPALVVEESAKKIARETDVPVDVAADAAS